MNTKRQPQNRYHAPLSEKPAEDLLYAIKVGQSDAAECRAELTKRGWKAAHIDIYVEEGYAALVRHLAGTAELGIAS